MHFIWPDFDIGFYFAISIIFYAFSVAFTCLLYFFTILFCKKHKAGLCFLINCENPSFNEDSVCLYSVQLLLLSYFFIFKCILYFIYFLFPLFHIFANLFKLLLQILYSLFHLDILQPCIRLFPILIYLNFLLLLLLWFQTNFHLKFIHLVSSCYIQNSLFTDLGTVDSIVW